MSTLTPAGLGNLAPGPLRRSKSGQMNGSRSSSISHPSGIQRAGSRFMFDEATASAIKELSFKMDVSLDQSQKDQDQGDEEDINPTHLTRINALPLSIVTLRNGLSNMGPSPEGSGLVYLKLSLPNLGMNSIDMLKNFKYIQTLQVPSNNLTDVSILGNMKYLVEVDLSNNRLTEVLKFDPPFNLQEADLSRNQIQIIRDLSEHRYLRRLCLDRNLVLSITGLSQCKYLTHLSLQRNGIEKIQGLDGLPLTFLDLSWNRIHVAENLHTLVDLEELHLAHNPITSLATMDVLPNLRVLNLDSNALDDVSDVTETLAGFILLRDLFVRRNPISAMPDHRLVMAYSLPFLSTLDGLPLAVEDKISAINRFDPPPEVVASVAHAATLKRQIRLYARLRAGDLQRARRLKPIVLCGPSGVGKRTLTARLLKEYPHIYGLAVSHTTRKPRPGEENGVHYHFVDAEEMERLHEEGAFIELVNLFGNQYGTSMSAIEKVTEEGKVCVMDLEIEGVLALKRSPVRPYYVFVTVPNADVLQQRLQNRMGTQDATTKSEAPSPTTTAIRLPTAEGGVSSQPSSRPTSGGSKGSASAASHMPSPLSKSAKLNNHNMTDKELEVRKWLAKAKIIERFGRSDGFFDFTIVNLELEKAYLELRDWCLKNYEEAYDEDE
ncbi:guanylate kinase [Synchytrium microbalum]|uniref:Guanylate kinase n=1 Tax=Synchytrium microbalum TaxID=1806994 RepID=A0A507BMF1_9FUNG|nr:guanylate kinase [Synchytrium microbalum]TPX31420.1 guanylate kinase [Synchytrium microbalum]